VLFIITAILFIGEKRREFAEDVYVHTSAFAELTSPKLVNDYKLYLSQKGFVYFNREKEDVFQKFEGLLSNMKIISYEGEVVFNAETDKEKQYEGASRKETDPDLLNEVQSRNPSVKTLDSKRIVYLKKDANNEFQYLDANEKAVAALAPGEKIAYWVQPATNDFAVVYDISYQALDKRIADTIIRTIELTVFGVGIGILLAFLYAGSITKPLKKLTEGAAIIATGNFNHRVTVNTKDEIFTLANAFNKMAQDLEISTKALVYKERVAKELELAAKIQKELLPKEIPKVSGLDISAGLLPAEEIGGDCYDFIKTDPNNLLLYLGDVTGHGVPSGIVVSIANALIYSFAGKADVKTILVDVNKILKEKTASNMFMTLVMLHWNALENRLKFVSAGHEQMIHYHAADKKVTLTPAGGLALGMFPDISKNLKENEIVLEKEDALVIYSDGIPECWKNEKEMFGMGNLKRSVNEYSDLPSAMAIRNALLAEVKQFAAGYKQMDDITLIVLKRK
jgi:HAMP domain-containing protein/cold shock CspA family protein